MLFVSAADTIETLNDTKKKKCNLRDCLKRFAAKEELKGSDAYYCSKCKKHRTSSKVMTVQKWPPVLVIHIKRFHKQKKLNTDVYSYELRTRATYGFPATSTFYSYKKFMATKSRWKTFLKCFIAHTEGGLIHIALPTQVVR